MHPRHAWTGFAMAAGASVLFGLMNVAIRWLGLNPLLMAAGSYLAAALLFARHLRRFRPAPRDRLPVVAVAAIGGAASPVAAFWGLRHATAVDASLLLVLEMVATAALAYVFLHERLAGHSAAGVAVLLAAAVLAALGARGSGETQPLGVLLVALAAVGWSVDNVLSTRLVAAYPAEQVLAAKTLLGGLLTLAAWLALGAPGTSWTAWGWAALLGAVGIGASLLLFYHALRRIGATRTTALNLPLMSLAGAAGGWLLLREPFGSWHGAAAALVAAGIFLLLPRNALGGVVGVGGVGGGGGEAGGDGGGGDGGWQGRWRR